LSDQTVPLLNLKAQHARIRGEIDAAIGRVVASQRFAGGPEVSAFESEFADFVAAAHAIGCASGSDALLLALMAIGIEPGDEVICPSYTFFATASAIHRLGARPVFADIDPVDFNVSVASLKEAVRSCAKLKAILPVHMFGQAGPIGEIVSLGEELGVPIIEDAAQASGSCDAEGRTIGARGLIACFSFYPSKNLAAYGDGGLLTTNDDAIAATLRVLSNHGMDPRYEHGRVGINSRLDAIQAAVLRVKLQHLQSWNAERIANADRYDALLLAAGSATGAGSFGDLALPVRLPARRPLPALHTFHQYVVRVPAEHRDPLREHLTRGGVGCEVYYPIPLHLQPCFAGLGHRAGDFPVAEQLARETLALPIYAELRNAQIETVVQRICEYFGV